MDCLDKSLCFVGRWEITTQHAVTAAPGSFFYLAFRGNDAVMHFETEWTSVPCPHLWVQVDGGTWTETALDRHLRIQAKEPGNHVAKIVFKSAVEMAHRWYPPLDGKVEFLGYDAEGPGTLSLKKKKTMEFVGDSITEGVLIDEKTEEKMGFFGRPYQDDAMASYAWLTAEALGLTPLIMGYGSVGVTKGGSGSVPKAAQAYPYCYHNVPVSYGEPDYVVINHGTNDCLSEGSLFISEYENLLDIIVRNRSRVQVFVMIPFCGVFREELKQIVEDFGSKHKNRIYLIDTTGWRSSPEPLHPGREEHKRLAAFLTRELQKFILSGNEPDSFY